MQTERRVAANLKTNPTDLGCESTGKYCCYPHSPSPKLLLLLLLLVNPRADTHFTAHVGWKAESIKALA